MVSYANLKTVANKMLAIPPQKTALRGERSIRILPGQYFDSETGLYYNWHRYYDPKVGRYISSDPIGLAGGLNTYLYANANPLSYIDPDGLFKMYGGWGGANYSGGQSGSTIPENPTPPKDTLDTCYKQHDYCYAAAASKSEDSQSSSCSAKPTIQDCDRQLAKCTLHIDYKSIGWWGKFFGPASTTWAVFKGELAK